MRSATAATGLAALALLTVLAGGLVAASPQPTPVCPVCGETFHENVTATTATLSMEADGDVRWHVENEVAEPTATEWRENPERAQNLAADAVDWTYQPPYDPSSPTVDVADGTVTISFVDRGAARQRLGVLVLPYLHGEGGEPRWVINADRFVVAAPPGDRILHNPAFADVEDDRAVWTGVAATDSDRSARSRAPEPGDTYVVAGSGPTAGARSAAVTTVMPLTPDLYLVYGFGLLFLGGAAYGLYAVGDPRLDRRREVAGVASSTLPYLGLLVWLHPPHGGFGGIGLFLFAFLMGLLGALVGGAAMHVWADVRTAHGDAGAADPS